MSFHETKNSETFRNCQKRQTERLISRSKTGMYIRSLQEGGTTSIVDFLLPSSSFFFLPLLLFISARFSQRRRSSQTNQRHLSQQQEFSSPFRLGLKQVTRASPSSGVLHVSCAAAVVVVGNQHFSVLIGPEAIEVNQDAGDGITLATVNQVLEGDLIGVFRLHHVKDLILDILEGDGLLSVEFHLLLNGPEEIVEGEDVEVSLILHVQEFKNILQRCWLLPVFQRQYKV